MHFKNVTEWVKKIKLSENFKKKHFNSLLEQIEFIYMNAQFVNKSGLIIILYGFDVALISVYEWLAL